MTDTVKILNTYRKSIINDKDSFEILYVFYKDGLLTEKAVADQLGQNSTHIRKQIRDLYKSNLLRLSGKNFALTSFADEIIASLGADSLVRPFIIHDIIGDEKSENLNKYIDFSARLEPDQERLTVKNLRNLKIFLSAAGEVSSLDKLNLTWMCATHHTGKTRGLLSNRFILNNSSIQAIDPEFSLTPVGYASFYNDYSLSCDINERLDAILLLSINERSDNTKSDRAMFNMINFRIFNYIIGDTRDYVLEGAFKRNRNMKREKRSAFDDIILNSSEFLSQNLIMDSINTFSYWLYGFSASDAVSSLLDKVIRWKTSKDRGTSFFGRMAGNSDLESSSASEQHEKHFYNRPLAGNSD